MTPSEYALTGIAVFALACWWIWMRRSSPEHTPQESPTAPIVAACHDVHGQWWMCGGCGTTNSYWRRFCWTCGRMELDYTDFEHGYEPLKPPLSHILVEINKCELYDPTLPPKAAQQITNCVIAGDVEAVVNLLTPRQVRSLAEDFDASQTFQALRCHRHLVRLPCPHCD